jgi:hypothetical protein
MTTSPIKVWLSGPDWTLVVAALRRHHHKVTADDLCHELWKGNDHQPWQESPRLICPQGEFFYPGGWAYIWQTILTLDAEGKLPSHSRW